MATEAVSREIVLITPGKIVGPGSEFELQRLALQKEATPIIESAKKITVNSVESAEQATQVGRVLQVAQKERETFFKNVKTQIDAVKKPVLEAEKADIGALEEQKTRLGSELTRFNEQQRKIREEAERAARLEAEKAAKSAREEQERIEREAILERAIELEAAGDSAQAEQVLNTPVVVEEQFCPVVIQAVQPPKISGQVGKLTYAMEVLDLLTLVKAVAENRAPLQALQANESYLNSKARLEKEGYAVSGTKLVKKESTHFRS